MIAHLANLNSLFLSDQSASKTASFLFPFQNRQNYQAYHCLPVLGNGGAMLS